MPQNIYDNPKFFEGYSQFGRSKFGLSAAPEWSQLQEMVPAMQGKKVLDLGCGYGWFSRWAANEGAEVVLGIDLSEKMLQKAKSMTNDNRIQYQQGDISDFNLPEKKFDIVFSSLAIHYLADFETFMLRVQQHTHKGGHFIASIEHPIFTAPADPAWQDGSSGTPNWPLNNYSAEGERRSNWITENVIKYHRTIATYINTIIRHRFTISRVAEWAPTDEDLREHPEWENHMHRPMFLLLSAIAQ